MNLDLQAYDIAELIAGAVFALSFPVQLIYYLVFYFRLLFIKKTKTRGASRFPVSVVICARDEARNLEKYLPVVLEQDFPGYEVIVVNDCSEDQTGKVLEKMQKRYKHLRSTTIVRDKKFTHGKKLALTVGIKAAKYDWLLLTDADCRPAGKHWIRSMQRNFTKDTDIVLGYGGYRKGKGILNLLIRYDTFFNAIQYLSMAVAGFPYMGVGRNLAYRKQVFFKYRGFASHSGVLSGDDDLFVNEAAPGENTRIEIDPASHTRSEPEKKLIHWLKQKKRHLTTGPHYRTQTKFLLGSELSSRILLYISLICLVICNSFTIPAISGYLLLLILRLTLIKIMSRRLEEKYLLLPSLLFDLLIPFINVFLFFTNYTEAKRNRWK